jgi:hypothetical protein
VITQVGTESLLNTRFDGGGNKGGYSDDYYWFDKKNGPSLVSFEPIWAAARTVLPKNTELWRGGDSNTPQTLTSMKFKLHTWKIGDSLCCEPEIVEVGFRLERGQVIVTGAQYIQNP